MRVILVAFSLVLLLFSCAEETDTELKHTKKLANDEDAVSLYNLMMTKKTDELINSTKKQANQGDAMAQLLLAKMYDSGLVLDSNK